MPLLRPLRPLLFGWLLSFAGWGLVGLAMAAQGVATRGDSWGAHLAPGLRDWLPWAVLTPLLFRLAARLPLERSRLRVALPVHLLCCVLVLGGVQWWKTSFRSHIGGGHPGGPAPAFHSGEHFPKPPDGGFRGPPPREHFGRGRGGFFDLLRFLTFDLPIYLMIMAGAHAALFFRRDQERAASLARARLDSLRMQLQPHFLFNTLNTISGLVHEEPDKADSMIVALSELLRLTLESSSAQEVSLAREMEFVERYLSLMHARFEDRLRFEIDVVPETRAALVPPMLLHPLVHHVIEHRLQRAPAGGRVIVRAAREGDALKIAIADDVAAPDQKGERAEFEMTRVRLRELYGNLASISAPPTGAGLVEIALPFRTSPLTLPLSHA